jgi:hypothetical protein
MGHAFKIYCKHDIYIHELSMKFQGKVKLLHDMFWDVKAFATSQSLADTKVQFCWQHSTTPK